MDNDKKELQEENKSFNAEVEQYSNDIDQDTPDQFAETVSENKDFMQRARDIADKGLDLVDGMATSEDEDTKLIYNLNDKKMDLDAADDQALCDMEKKIQSEISKIMHAPDMSVEEKDACIKQWEEYYKIIKESHNESKDKRQEVVKTQVEEADKKRAQHRKTIECLCLLGLSLVSGGAGFTILNHTPSHKK